MSLSKILFISSSIISSGTNPFVIFAFAKIKEFEGCRLSAYTDSVGVPTIGVGHTKGVKMGQKISMEQAESFLREDLFSVEKYVNTIPEVNTQGKFDALVDFAFNLGIGALQRSTLLKKIKAIIIL